MAPFAIASAADSASINVNPSTKCKLGTVTSTGTFRLQAGGPGGTVRFTWIYKDTDATGNTIVTTHTGQVVVAAGDANAHSFTDTYAQPNSAGTVQLVFSSPSYNSAQLIQSWSCRQ